MTLKEPVLKILSKTYEPNQMIEQTFMRYNMAFKTDEAGRPILLFMGHKDDRGVIKGDRYARRLTFDKDGKVVKDHWDHKGKAT